MHRLLTLTNHCRKPKSTKGRKTQVMMETETSYPEEQSDGEAWGLRLHLVHHLISIIV